MLLARHELLTPKLRRRRVSGHAQAPANGKSWTVRAADKNGVVQIPDSCLTRRVLVKHIIRFAVSVKIRRGYQRPATGKGRPPSGPNKGCPRQIKDSCVACIGTEQEIIRVAIAIKIRYSHQCPSAWNAWAGVTTNQSVII